MLTELDVCVLALHLPTFLVLKCTENSTKHCEAPFSITMDGDSIRICIGLHIINMIQIKFFDMFVTNEDLLHRILYCFVVYPTVLSPIACIIVHCIVSYPNILYSVY